MSDLAQLTGLTIFVGRFGSGKTETAINYALWLARNGQSRMRGGGCESAGCVLLVDLDIVTPYFRSREMAQRMEQRGVEVIAPAAVGQHLDTPAITPQILGAIQQMERPVVVDVGGDRQGARALGQFSAAARRRGYAMYFVVNPYRPFTDTLAGLTNSISEIEASTRLRVTALVSNPNLMNETNAEQIIAGHAQIEEFARVLNLNIAFVCLERRWADELDSFAQPVLVLERHFVMSWE